MTGVPHRGQLRDPYGANHFAVQWLQAEYQQRPYFSLSFLLLVMIPTFIQRLELFRSMDVKFEGRPKPSAQVPYKNRLQA